MPGFLSALFLSAPLVTALLLGATGLLVLINLGQALVRRESLNLWLAIYASALSAALLCLWQVSQIDPQTSAASVARLACRMLLIIAMMAQCRLVFRFAPLPNTHRLWSRYFIGLSIGCILLASAAASALHSPLAGSILKVMFLLSTALCVIHLSLLTRQHEPNALFLLLAKCFALGAFGGAWWLTTLYSGRPINHWLAQSTIIVESMLITYALVMNSVEHWQQRIRMHYERTLDLKLKQQYNTTLKLVDHELRTPLSGVVGIAELLLDTSLTKTQRDQISTMRRASESLLKWLNRLNDWRALQIGRLHFDAIPFDFSQMLQTLFEDSRVKAVDRKITLTYEPPPNTPALIKGDPARLKQIISGTLEMALYYSEQGNINIELQPLSSQRNRWQLIITDSQSGLHQEDIHITLANGHEKDAEHFTSVQRNWLIAKALTNHIGGDLTAELEDGHARFTCDLILPRYSLLQHHENQYDQLLNKKRLLVVDDSSSSRKLVAKRADSWGIKSTCVTNGNDALGILNTLHPLGANFDVVILDYDLPDMTGLDLAKRIAQHPALEHTPILIMLSGEKGFPSEEQASNAFIKRVLTKPVSSQSLKITLAEELTVQKTRQKSPPSDNPGG